MKSSPHVSHDLTYLAHHQLTCLPLFKSVSDFKQDPGQHGHLQGSPRLLLRPHGRAQLQVEILFDIIHY